MEEVKMAVRTQEEIMNTLNTILGDNNSDDVVTLLEDMSDTFDDYETRVSDTTDWKTKYEENDKQWREKYRKRFGQGSEGGDGGLNEPKPLTFDNLFK